MNESAATPEELDSLLEDAFILQDAQRVAQLFKDTGVLVDCDGCESRGRREIASAVEQMWHTSYLAQSPRVVQAKGTALIASSSGLHVASRGPDGLWRYTIATLHRG